MDENKSLIKSTRTISAATLASRILGFLRDAVIAKFFGTGLRAQAFVVSFRIPNLLRDIVAEGAANSAVVPVLSRLHAQGKDAEFWQVANCLLNILVIILAGLTLLGELFTPYIVRLIAPGFIQDPEKLYLTVRLTRFLFPYILLIGLSAYAMAVLNSLKTFTLPALAPCLLNISLIASALIFCPRLKEPVDGLALGALIGGLLQFVIQVPALVQKGQLKKSRLSFIHPRIKEIGRLFFPRLLGISVYQLNLFVDTIFSSLTTIVGEGAPAALQYANRIVQFPLALFGVALAQVALPTMSGLAEQKDLAQLKKTVSFSLRSVFTLMVPATLGIIVLAKPLVKIIFERGSFTSYSTGITASALLFYCLALSGYAGIKILASSFYSLKDTFTPGKIAAIALLINVILNFILMRPLKIAGLALATAISVSANFILLLSALQRKIGRFCGFMPTLGKVILASAMMSAALWFLFYQVNFFMATKLLLTLKLLIVILVGMGVYAGSLKMFAQEEAGIFLAWMLKKK